MDPKPSDPPMPKLDRTAFSVSDSFDDPEEKAYWLSRTPQERIAHMEFLRRLNYGAAATGRMEKVLEIVEWDDDGTTRITRLLPKTPSADGAVSRDVESVVDAGGVDSL